MWAANFIIVVLAVWCLSASAAVVERGHDVGKIQNDTQRAAACDKDLDCGGLKDVKCKFDSEENKKVCQCDDTMKTYVPSRKQCAYPCYKISDCKGGLCRLRYGDKKFCSCFGGYSGDFCDISACETLCGKSDNVRCSFEEDIPFCVCSGDKQGFDYDTKTCRECDCGHINALCEYRNNKRVCHCEKGSYEKNGICEDCDCGEDGMAGCEFPNGKKKCFCGLFNKLNNGKCEMCECGWNSHDCNFENGKQVCLCRKGYLQDHENQCRSCKCGDHGKCSLDEHSFKVCECDKGYANHDGICEPCKCSGGTKSDFCKFNFFGAMECDCKDGYAQKESECLKCDCGVSGRCYFDSWSGRKECHCDDGFKGKDGKCIRN